jgi:transposase-like protein
MKIVETNSDAVETALVARKLHCPSCDGILAPWAHGRERVVRLEDVEERRTLRRSRCTSCEKTHVLVPSDTLVRRRDGVEVIGPALVSSAGGTGFRKIATRIGRPAETVRGWVRRARDRVEEIRVHFTRWSVALDGSTLLEATGSALADAMNAIGHAGRAAVLRKIAANPWHFCSGATAGMLLSNTSSPWLSPFDSD